MAKTEETKMGRYLLSEIRVGTNILHFNSTSIEIKYFPILNTIIKRIDYVFKKYFSIYSVSVYTRLKNI